MSGLPPIATAELLAVGAELLVGETRDTNSGDLARSLTELGVDVRRISQLPDELEVIATAIGTALERADLVVTTGGLGPTPDDLTREGIARALDETPAIDPGLLAWLEDLFERRRLPFSSTNTKQAWLIPSATAMPNPHGTAPGWWVETGDRVVIALPGPPRELEPMWREHALPRLAARGLGIDRAVETLRLTGIGESALVDVVGTALLEAANPRMATYARAESVDLRVSAVGDGRSSAREIVDAAVAELLPRVGSYVFAHGDEDWATALAARMGGRRLATFEIGTAGQLAALLGGAPYLDSAQFRRLLPSDAGAGPAELAAATREQAGTEIGLAAIAIDQEDDMRVEVGIDIEGRRWQASHAIFRGGDIGRRRSANAAAAELWRRLRG